MIGDVEAKLASAVTDGDDRLLSADDPLAALQLRCGGTIPGAIAIPELAQLVCKARRLQLRLARPITAQDGRDAIRAWVEVAPRDCGKTGCAIAVQHWHAVPLPRQDSDMALRRSAEIDRALAELTARLDHRQRLLWVEGEAPDLTEVIAAMRRGPGRCWTEFVTIVGEDHRSSPRGLREGMAVAVAGSSRAWRATLVPQTGAGEAVTGFELFLTAETPLAEPADRLGDADPTDFAGVIGEHLFGRGIAPVLRQPIARIIAHAETIRMRLAGPLDDDYAGFAADIVTAGEHLLALVDDLADLESLEAEHFSTIADAVDLADVARRAASILSARARSKQIAVTLPPADATLPARADLRRVLQVMLNLIGNALHYAPEKTRISLELGHARGWAQVTVADQGPGLSDEQQSRVFDKFERLGHSGDGGSGLGLYISRRLARAMQGDVTVASAPGEGARFTLSLPVK